MKFRINLLQESQKFQSQIGKYGLILQSASVLVLIVFVVMTFFVLSYRTYLAFEQGAVKKQVEELKTAIKGFEQLETKYTYKEQRVSLIHNIMKEHVIDHGILFNFYDELGSLASIDSMKILENEKKFDIQLNASDPFAFEKAIKFIAEYEYDYTTNEVSSDKIQMSGEKGYSTLLTVYYD
jgi:type II secretory pathway component PulL